MTKPCVICGTAVEMNKKTLTAIKVNKDGPYCLMCHHGVMFFRHCQHRDTLASSVLVLIEAHETK